MILAMNSKRVNSLSVLKKKSTVTHGGGQKPKQIVRQNIKRFPLQYYCGQTFLTTPLIVIVNVDLEIVRMIKMERCSVDNCDFF